MLSRVAESLYWMSRYLERAENTARLLDVHLNLNLELSPQVGQRRYLDLLRALQVTYAHSPPSPSELALDGALPESISSCVAAARENARQIREQISSEMFEQVNKLFLFVRARTTHDRFAVEPHSVFQKVKDGVHLFQGITDSTMTHGQGWHWIQAGRYLERAHLRAALLLHNLPWLFDSGEAESQHYSELLGLLKSCTAWEAYCKVHGAELNDQRVAEFLLLNREFPHSLNFSIDQVAEALQALAQDTGMTAQSELEHKVGKWRARLRYASLPELLEQSLPQTLEQLRSDLLSAHQKLYQIYLSHSFERATL
jgi:uncharacterized alpha-E superfamily protein